MSSFTLSVPDSPVNGAAKRPATITLRVQAGHWLADMSQARPDVVRLFGTSWLATPFTAEWPAQDVAAEIRLRNPGCRVVVAE
jgi:hypothetical protein